MIRRVAATQATLDRFQGKPLTYGRDDCARMVAFHLRRLKRPIALAKAGTYSSALGARRAMARFGVASLGEALDKHGLFRIAPAAAVAGDILELAGDDAMGALAIALGNGRALSWHVDAPGATVVQPLAVVAAWTVE